MVPLLQEKAGMLLNGFVHSLMYYHYAFRLPRFLRPIITICQIIQLLTVTWLWHIVPTTCVNFRHFPVDHFYENIIPYTMVPVYTIFFMKFFFQQYILQADFSKQKAA